MCAGGEGKKGRGRKKTRMKRREGGEGGCGPLKCEECATSSHCLSLLSQSKKTIMSVESGKMSRHLLSLSLSLSSALCLPPQFLNKGSWFPQAEQCVQQHCLRADLVELKLYGHTGTVYGWGHEGSVVQLEADQNDFLKASISTC